MHSLEFSDYDDDPPPPPSMTPSPPLPLPPPPVSPPPPTQKMLNIFFVCLTIGILFATGATMRTH